jgi:protein TonB
VVIGGTGRPGGGGGLGSFTAQTVEAPPQERPRLVVSAQPTPIGGDVQNARAISRPQPVYPKIAIQTRTQGVVRMEAVISKMGTIENLKVLSGHPLLIQAAQDAVLRWRYRPTILNGEPVEVITTIEVHFILNQ